MSLDLAGFTEACRRWDELDERIRKLLGFNPAKDDHYGYIRMYNEFIDTETTDERIVEIFNNFVKWRNEILDFFEKNDYKLDIDQLKMLFRMEWETGLLKFLGIYVRTDLGTEPFEKAIIEYIQSKKNEQEVEIEVV